MTDQRPTIHSMPLESLRASTREALRLVEQARSLVRESFERNVSPDSGREKQVGAMLDAIERILPGIGVLAVQRVAEGDRPRHDSGMLVPTPRERTREQVERSELIATVVESLTGLLQEIERARTSSVMRIETTPSTMPPSNLKS
jgi:hypothetical protein